MINDVLKSSITKNAEEVVGRKPSTEVGWPVDTNSIVTDSYKGNPYFVSLGNVSQKAVNDYLSTVKADGSNISVVTHKTTYLNPRAVDGIQGGESGKLFRVGKNTMVEMHKAGNNQQTPTIFAVTSYTFKDGDTANASEHPTTTAKDRQDNKVVSDADNKGLKGSTSSTNIKANGDVTRLPNYTRDANGKLIPNNNNISLKGLLNRDTGTLRVTPSELRDPFQTVSSLESLRAIGFAQ